MVCTAAGAPDRDQWFEEFGVLEEAGTCAANIFVWIVPDIIIRRLEQTNMVPSSTYYKIVSHGVAICAISSVMCLDELNTYMTNTICLSFPSSS